MSSTIWLDGEHDASTADDLQAVLARAITAMSLDVVVDLSGVEFMASATVQVLARARAGLAAQARTLTLQAPSAPAQRVLGLCDMPLSVLPVPRTPTRLPTTKEQPWPVSP